MKKRTFVAGLMALIMSLSVPVFAFAAVKFVPTPPVWGYPWDLENTEYFAPVKSLMDRNILMGKPDGYFHPEGTLTRAELATVLAKISGISKQSETDIWENYYTDLQGYDWAKRSINACKRQNLLQGKGKGEFDPAGKVSYIEFLAAIVRFKNSQLQLDGKWPDNYIFYVKNQFNNLIEDRDIADFNAPITRGDMAVILYRAASKTTFIKLTYEEALQKSKMVSKWNLPEPVKNN